MSLTVGRVVCLTGLDGPPDVPAFAPNDASHQIAEGALQTFVAFDDVDIIVIAVVLDATAEKEVVTHRVGAEPFESEERVDHVPGRLGHFLAPKRPVGVGHDLLGQGKVKGKEEGGPVDTVETDNVFTNDVDVGRPARGMLLSGELKGIIGLGEIVDQGIEPDVDGLRGIVGDGYAPRQAFDGSRYGKVGKAVRDLLDDVLHTGGRLHELGVVCVVLK